MLNSGMDARTDDQLVRAASRGDHAAFEVLYFRHRDFVYRVALRHTRGHAAALDVAQDTFAYLLRKLPGLRLSGKLSTYLYPVIRNIALAQLRRPDAALSASIGPARDVESPATASDDALDRHLIAAVERLPDAQREVLLLRVVDELSVDEVAAALGVPPGTIKSRLHNALAMLRNERGLRDWFDQS